MNKSTPQIRRKIKIKRCIS